MCSFKQPLYLKFMQTTDYNNVYLNRIAVVIPCYRVKAHVLQVIEKIGNEVSHIYAVDDACPEQSGLFITAQCHDPRVTVLYNTENQGVGGAVCTGYQQALQDGMDIIVKIDGDGQMNPELLPQFVAPLINGEADYCKGNRFYHLDDSRTMPKVRLFGNLALSFMTKFSSGYWDIFDPTNGYTAIHRSALQHINLTKLARRYFFESDLLFRLNLARARVLDIPMRAIYGDEVSNLHIRKILKPFLKGHAKNTIKRLIYSYFIRDFNVASIELIVGMGLFGLGSLFGIIKWIEALYSATPASSGTVMLAALPVILGFQCLLAFLNYDCQAMPKHALPR